MDRLPKIDFRTVYNDVSRSSRSDVVVSDSKERECTPLHLPISSGFLSHHSLDSDCPDTEGTDALTFSNSAPFSKMTKDEVSESISKSLYHHSNENELVSLTMKPEFTPPSASPSDRIRDDSQRRCGLDIDFDPQKATNATLTLQDCTATFLTARAFENNRYAVTEIPPNGDLTDRCELYVGWQPTHPGLTLQINPSQSGAQSLLRVPASADRNSWATYLNMDFLPPIGKSSASQNSAATSFEKQIDLSRTLDLLEELISLLQSDNLRDGLELPLTTRPYGFVRTST